MTPRLAIGGATAGQRAVHLANCKGSLEEVKGKLELAIVYQTLCQEETDARLRSGLIGFSETLRPPGVQISWHEIPD